MSDDGPKSTADDYRRSLLAVRDATPQKNMDVYVALLEAQYACPQHRATSTQMAEAIDLAGYAEANLRYGKLAHAVADQFDYEPPKRAAGDRKPRWWMALSTGQTGSEGDGHFEFTMRPDLVAALEAMRWVRPAD